MSYIIKSKNSIVVFDRQKMIYVAKPQTTRGNELVIGNREAAEKIRKDFPGFKIIESDLPINA